MGRRRIEEELFSKYSIVDNNSPEGQKIHAFLLARAKALAGKYIDFDETPVTFLLSDNEAPNAFFMDVFDPEKAPNPDDYKPPRYVRNPLDTPVICVTTGLIEFVDNLDQLDYVLGHEMTHMMMRGFGIPRNSKGEEELADLHAVDLMYDAGADPKEALALTEKFALRAEELKKKKKAGSRRHRSKEEEKGVNWSEIFDVHMTRSNRRAGVEASLTRISHLIDDREPSDFDKSILDVSYTDPVDSFLRENAYEGRKPLGKLKILVDAIDHIARHIPAREYFEAELAALPAEDPDGFDWRTRNKREEIEERMAAGDKGYFSGATVDKKYQQKIARLAEEVINGVAVERRDNRRNPNKPAAINTHDLNTYLQDRAYRHIDEHGYPQMGHYNYPDAAGILYTYFYKLFGENGHKKIKFKRGMSAGDLDDDEIDDTRVKPQIEVDIEAEKDKIRTAATAEEFIEAAERFKKLRSIVNDLRTATYGSYGDGEKFDNLSAISSHGFRYREDEELSKIYPTLSGGEEVPWDNLYRIAQTGEKTREYVVSFLAGHHITDYRLTDDLPYVRAGYGDGFKVDADGRTSTEEVPEYVIDFEANREAVIEAYAYIRTYFEQEESLLNAACESAINTGDQDFIDAEDLTDSFNRNTIAHKKLYDFVSAFNSLPDEEEDHRRDRSEVVSFIPERHLTENPVPGSRKVSSSFGDKTVYGFTRDLLKFDNPVFMEHFGDDFEERLKAKKASYQQRMFDTAFTLLGNAIDVLADLKPEMEELDEKIDDLQRQIWDAEDGKNTSDLKRKLKPLREKQAFYKKKREHAEQIIYNFLHSIFDGEQYWYNLQRLTPEQKTALAEWAVKDEKGVIRDVRENRGYEQICDSLDILKDQTERVMSGDYSLTPMMQIVVDNYGYTPADTKEQQRAFAQQVDKDLYEGEDKKYTWYLHIFDSMRRLESSPSMDVGSFATVLSYLHEETNSGYMDDSHSIKMSRVQNHKDFITQSRILELAARAIDFKENYDDLSVEDLISTADRLIELRKKLKEVLKKTKRNDDWGYGGEKEYLEPEHERFLRLIDKNIRGAFRRAEHQALLQQNPLARITSLYKVYNEKTKYSSSDRSRSPYLGVLIKQENRLQKLSALSEDEDFWPEDALDHVKAYVFAKNTFLDDRDFEDKLLNNILDKVEALPSCKKKNECLHILLDKNLRAPYPETRDRLFSIYVRDVTGKLGQDDGSQRYKARLGQYLHALNDDRVKAWDLGKEHGSHNPLLSNSMAAADKYLLLRELADSILSQEQTSDMLKEECQVNLNSKDMVKSYLYGIGVDYMTSEMDRDPESAKKFIAFLNSRGDNKECADISAYIAKKAEKRWREHPDRLKDVLRNTTPSHCKILYENFWSAPLEARAVIIARMLKSSVVEEADQKTDARASWERIFDVVMDAMISQDDQSIEAKYARDIMHSYIKARSDYERELILSAMMVANRNIGEDAGNVGKALKLFLENMGPAEIKLGQAIASHPGTPESIRKELQKLKNEADRPARWTIYDWIKAENIPEKFWKNKYMGAILGSASYYTTIALGDDEVIRILRPEAREKAAKGFKVIGLTVDDLRTKDQVSDLDYAELTSSVQEMVKQAARMSHIETDHDIGEQQYRSAQDIYNGVTISCDDETFTLKVMDWNAKGQNWMVLDRATGFTFNDLPAETPEQVAYKKKFAKAYIVFEVTNIISGGKFDHDKHGAQLCINTETNEVGIFDTGAMALDPPKPEDQRILGNVIYDVIKDTMQGQASFTAFSRTISEKIDELHDAGVDTQYLVEVKKGLLALGDFFKVLDEGDVQDIMPDVDMLDQLSDAVQEGIDEKMTLAEKSVLRLVSSTDTPKKPRKVTINRGQVSSVSGNVINVDVQPTVPAKASWFRDAFTNTNSDDDGGNSNDNTPFAPSRQKVTPDHFQLTA